MNRVLRVVYRDFMTNEVYVTVDHDSNVPVPDAGDIVDIAGRTFWVHERYWMYSSIGSEPSQSYYPRELMLLVREEPVREVQP